MTKNRSYSIAFKRQVAEEYLAGAAPSVLGERHDVCRNLVRIWMRKYEAGEYDDDARAADTLQEFEAKVAALEQLVGRAGAGDRVFKKGREKRTLAERRAHIRDHRPAGVSVARGCALMGVARSSFYAVAEVRAISAAFPAYGYRRVGAEVRHRGLVVNGKKLRRILREQGLNPRARRRRVATTTSSHGGRYFPNLAKGFEVHGPDKLWVADITFVAIRAGFVYLAVVLDAWSRRVVGYALDRHLDARLTTTALGAALLARRPLPGCLFHSDRGVQYSAEPHRALLAAHGLTGSMSRRGNPYDNSRAESFFKTLKVEAVYVADYETFADVAAELPASSTRSTTKGGSIPRSAT